MLERITGRKQVRVFTRPVVVVGDVVPVVQDRVVQVNNSNYTGC